MNRATFYEARISLSSSSLEHSVVCSTGLPILQMSPRGTKKHHYLQRSGGAQTGLLTVRLSYLLLTPVMVTALATTKTTEQSLGCRKGRKKGRKQKGEGRSPWRCKMQGLTRFSCPGNQPLVLDRPAKSPLGNLLKPPESVSVSTANK